MTNEFGMVMRQGTHYMELIGHPLAHVSDPAEVADFPFPDPLAPGRLDDAERRDRAIQGAVLHLGRHRGHDLGPGAPPGWHGQADD